jgi:tetratricopeptide (TPR) repeat protein
VQGVNGKLRANAQLIDALNGHHIWADSFDVAYQEIFELQDKITRKIVEELHAELLHGEQAKLWRSSTTSPEAYEMKLRARNLIFQYTRADNAKARKLANEAIRIDPDYPGAYETLAWTYLIERWFGWTKDQDQALILAAAMARRALDLDGDYGPAHVLIATIHLERREFLEAVASAEVAVSINPGAGDLLSNAGWILKYAGEYQQAVELMQRGVRLDPLAPLPRFDQLASAYWLTGRFREMVEISERIVSRPLTSRRFIITHLRLAAVHWRQGKKDEARKYIEKVMKAFPDTTISAMEKTPVLAWYKDQSVPQGLADIWRDIGVPE